MADYLLPAVLFSLNIFAESQTNLTDKTSQINNERKQTGGVIIYQCKNGQYSKVSDHTCCQNQTMEGPISVDTAFYRKDLDMETKACALELNKTDSDDMPTSLWNEYLCMFKKEGGNSSVLETYKGFTDFMTSKYPEPLKSQILEQIHKTNAVGESETDEVKRFEIFQMQMYQAEKQSNCKTEGFPNSLGVLRCCKGRYAPMGIPSPPSLGFISNDEMDKIANCSRSFVNRQKELSSSFQKAKDDLKTDPTNVATLARKPNQCSIACEIEGISQYGSIEDLKIDLEAIKTKLIAKFSKSTRKDLLALLDAYSDLKFYQRPDNSTMTMNEAVKLVESLTDEENKIVEYCVFHSFVQIMVEISLLEYCGYKDALALYKMMIPHPDTDVVYY